jgi:hypothetical protein
MMTEPGQIVPIPIIVMHDSNLVIPMIYMGVIGFTSAMVAFSRDKLLIGLGLFMTISLVTVLFDYFNMLPWKIFP